MIFKTAEAPEGSTLKHRRHAGTQQYIPLSIPPDVRAPWTKNSAKPPTKKCHHSKFAVFDPIARLRKTSGGDYQNLRQPPEVKQIKTPKPTDPRTPIKQATSGGKPKQAHGVVCPDPAPPEVPPLEKSNPSAPPNTSGQSGIKPTSANLRRYRDVVSGGHPEFSKWCFRRYSVCRIILTGSGFPGISPGYRKSRCKDLRCCQSNKLPLR